MNLSSSNKIKNHVIFKCFVTYVEAGILFVLNKEVRGSGPGLARVDSEDPLCASDNQAQEMGGVNPSRKQRMPVAPQNGDIVTTIFFSERLEFNAAPRVDTKYRQWK